MTGKSSEKCEVGPGPPEHKSLQKPELRFHAFFMIMGLIESGPAALSGSKELTASSSRLGL